MSLDIGIYFPFKLSYRDKGGEIGTMSGFGIPSALDDIDDIAAMIIAFNAFVTATEGIVLGVLTETRYLSQVVHNPVSLAASPSAQRENKLLVRFHDNSTLRKAEISVPTIDLPNLVFETDAKDYVSKSLWGTGTNTVMTGWITAFQNFVRIPYPDQTYPGTGVVVDSLQYVGRNT